MRQLLLAAGLLALVGCGDPTLEVRGKVTYNGKPIANGTIAFEPKDLNGPTKAHTITDGAYHLTGPNKVEPGTKVVRIQAFGPSGRKVSAAPGSKTMVDEWTQYIPPQYNLRSTLEAPVETGKENTFDFDLRP